MLSEPNAIFDAALALPEGVRLKLADELLASVKPPGIWSIDDPGFDAELERRRQGLRDGTAKTYTAEETIAAMRRIVEEHRGR